MLTALCKLFERCARRTLDQHADGAVGQLQQLQNLRDHADVKQVISFGVVATRIKLSEQEDVLAAFHCRFEGCDRFVASDKQRHHHSGKYHDVAQGEEGEGLGHQSIPFGAGKAVRSEYGETSRAPQRRAPKSCG